jgi:hypothetical protein
MAKAKVKADTLLRKIQKGGKGIGGQFNQGVSNMMSKFNFSGTNNDRIQIFKKREIVQPYLHPLDSRMVNEQVEKVVKSALKNVDPKIEENYSKFLPTHLVNDLYSLYYNPSNRMKFEGLDKTNEVKFGILDSINNSLLKIVTNNSHIGSYVYTEAIGQFLYKKFMEMPPEQQQKLQDSLNNCNQGGGGGMPPPPGGGSQKPNQGGNQPPDPSQPQQPGPSKGKPSNDPPDDEDEEGFAPPDEDIDDDIESPSQGDEKSNRNGDNNHQGAANNSGKSGRGSEKDMSQEAADQMDEDLKKMVENLNSKQAQKELEQALKKADEKLEKLRDVGVDIENDEEMPEDEKREIIKNLNNLDSIRRSLQALSTSKDKILKAVEKILNGTTNYFSQKCIQNDVELFEADQLLDINGLEFLHPLFRNSRLFDLSVTERRYIGKFDLYVDCSGSMGGGCGGDLAGVPRIDLAKSLAMQMKELGILGDLYEFEDRPKKIMNTDMSILMMAARGGTDIEYVLKNILKTGNNSVVLSDGESHVDTYTHKAFFIGVGTDFSYFKNTKGAGQKFVEEGQCVYYNGKSFEEVMPRGTN